MSAVNDAVLTIIMNFVDGDYSTTELVGDLQALGEAYAEEQSNAVMRAIEIEREAADNRVAAVEAALEEARSHQYNVVKLDAYKLFEQAFQMKSDFIQYVKWVRESGVLTVNGETGCELYVARFVAEFVFAMYGYRDYFAPTRGEELFVIGMHSNRRDVVRNLRLFLAHNYNGYVIDVSDPYGM